MSRLVTGLNTRIALVADVTGRGAELIRGVASTGVTGLVCCVAADDEHWRHSVEQVTLGCEGLPWGAAAVGVDPLDEHVMLALIEMGADFIVMQAETFPAWGLDVLESFPKVGRVVSVGIGTSGEALQSMEMLGPQAFVMRIEESIVTIEELGRAKVLAESVGLRVLAWMPELTARDSRLLRQVGVTGFVVGVGKDQPEQVLGRMDKLMEAISEPVQVRSPLT